MCTIHSNMTNMDEQLLALLLIIEDTYKARIQLLNYTDTSMRCVYIILATINSNKMCCTRYQLSFAKTHLVITPSQGVLKRR